MGTGETDATNDIAPPFLSRNSKGNKTHSRAGPTYPSPGVNVTKSSSTKTNPCSGRVGGRAHVQDVAVRVVVVGQDVDGHGPFLLDIAKSSLATGFTESEEPEVEYGRRNSGEGKNSCTRSHG